MSKLVLRNVSRTFGNFTAVENFNLALEEGELVSLLGPSGCGKTTTLRMIAGFMTPTAGTIEVDGQVISSPTSSLPPEKRQMSMIFQSYAIWPNMTVAENVGFGLKIRKFKADEIRRRVGEILEVVQMGDLRDRYPAELSGGQPWRGPSWSSPPCCCWTNRSPTWMRTCARRCASRFAGCTTSSRSPWCT